LLLAALERGDDAMKTGRFLITFKEGAAEAGLQALQAQRGLRVANARDFNDQAVNFEEAGDAEAMVFPEIGVALVGSQAAIARGLGAEAAIEEDSPFHSVDPEYFMFATQINPRDYLKGVLHATQTIYADLGQEEGESAESIMTPEVLGATWGLNVCKVPPSGFSGVGMKTAVLDTGFDLGHPEFAGRSFVTKSFVGQPVQDLHGHGTHTTGTACGPRTPAGSIPRYGIGYKVQIFSGKVLTNAGSGTQAQVLAEQG